MKINRIFIILAIAAVLLFIPLIAMQFTTEVYWTMGDFIIMGVLLLVTGFFGDLIYRKVPANKRVIFLILLVGAFLLIWAEMAVGIFGSPIAGS